MEKNLAHGSVLIVDNDQQTIDVLREGLSAKGYKVMVATNGTEALECIKQRACDIIITDLDMPDVDGYKLIDIIGAAQRDHKVMVVTEHQVKREQLLKRGVLEAFDKPESLERFMDEVVALLEQRRRTKRFGPAEEHRNRLECVLRDKLTKREHKGVLLNISMDGALIETTENVSSLRKVELDFSLTDKASMICRVNGRVVRVIEGEGDEKQVAIYFDNDRDLALLEKMAPYINLFGKQ